MAALGVGDVVGPQRGARGNLQLVRVEVLEGNGVEVVALFRITCVGRAAKRRARAVAYLEKSFNLCMF